MTFSFHFFHFLVSLYVFQNLKYTKITFIGPRIWSKSNNSAKIVQNQQILIFATIPSSGTWTSVWTTFGFNLVKKKTKIHHIMTFKKQLIKKIFMIFWFFQFPNSSKKKKKKKAFSKKNTKKRCLRDNFFLLYLYEFLADFSAHTLKISGFFQTL